MSTAVLTPLSQTQKCSPALLLKKYFFKLKKKTTEQYNQTLYTVLYCCFDALSLIHIIIIIMYLFAQGSNKKFI